MNEYSVNSGNDLLYSLLANPAEMTHSDAFNLQMLINEYPQSGVLWLLLAEKNGHEGVSRAVPHVKPELLFKAAQGAYKFPPISTAQIQIAREQALPQVEINVEDEEQPAIAEADISQNEEDQTTELLEQDPLPLSEEHTDAEPYAVEELVENNEAVGEIAGDESRGDDHVENDGEEDDVPAVAVDDTNSSGDNTTAEQTDEVPKYFHQEIDDEVFEEIVSIEDINLEQRAFADSAVVAEVEESIEVVSPEVQKKAGDSFFVFEPSPSEDSHLNPTESGISGQTLLSKGDGQPVAKYHDEKLPYSFLWWLDKTRREHAGLYRPYASQTTPQLSSFIKKEQPQQMPDNLQQQYYENIFAVSPAVADLNTTPNEGDAPAPETKEAKIIERFIQEEPQIKHPNEAKLNNENKAKKSAEDRDELVTETLAKIYSDQMLYHKAISTYKKLMLKFPEKSLYFAGQIEQLESKIN